MRRLLALACLVGLLLVGSPALADHQTTGVPLADHPAARSKFVVEGPVKTWSVRRTLYDADQRIDEIDVVKGDCSDYPSRVCVRVRFYYNSQSPYFGYVIWEDLTRRVYLNKYYAQFYVSRYLLRVGAHEAGHVLGLRHHPHRGVVGGYGPVANSDWVMRLSRIEAWSVRSAYTEDDIGTSGGSEVIFCEVDDIL